MDGTTVIVIAVIALCVIFGGKNVFSSSGDSKGSGRTGGSSNGSDGV